MFWSSTFKFIIFFGANQFRICLPGLVMYMHQNMYILFISWQGNASTEEFPPGRAARRNCKNKERCNLHNCLFTLPTIFRCLDE